MYACVGVREDDRERELREEFEREREGEEDVRRSR